MTATTTKITLADVHVGDMLPELAYPVTATTIVLGALALVTIASARRSPDEVDAELDAVGATP